MLVLRPWWRAVVAGHLVLAVPLAAQVAVQAVRELLEVAHERCAQLAHGIAQTVALREQRGRADCDRGERAQDGTDRRVSHTLSVSARNGWWATAR